MPPLAAHNLPVFGDKFTSETKTWPHKKKLSRYTLGVHRKIRKLGKLQSHQTASSTTISRTPGARQNRSKPLRIEDGESFMLGIRVHCTREDERKEVKKIRNGDGILTLVGGRRRCGRSSRGIYRSANTERPVIRSRQDVHIRPITKIFQDLHGN